VGRMPRICTGTTSFFMLKWYCVPSKKQASSAAA
jgi:hypothetical protein